jgi:hypothetical protein
LDDKPLFDESRPLAELLFGIEPFGYKFPVCFPSDNHFVFLYFGDYAVKPRNYEVWTSASSDDQHNIFDYSMIVYIHFILHLVCATCLSRRCCWLFTFAYLQDRLARGFG